MKKDKIKNNFSFSKMEEELQGAKSLAALSKIAGFFGLKSDKLNESFSSLPQFEEEFIALSSNPDRFNEYFSERGWIAHESMHFDLMKKCINLADNGKIDEAETLLVDYYTSKEIKWLIHRLKGLDEFKIRYNFFSLAYEDTLACRYHATVPVLLIMIDGAVNDISKQTGFFAENTNMTAWDSIAAHSSGLTVLKEIFSNGRNKTNTETLHLPYRHGIIHGRDLGYANKEVTAKCWAALFSVSDWARALKEGKKNPPPPQKKPGLIEGLIELNETLKKLNKTKKRGEEVSHKVQKWQARKLLINIDLPEQGFSKDYPSHTPEHEAIKFIENWKSKNFGGIAQQIHSFSQDKNQKKEAGEVRKIFENKILNEYKIIKIEDCSPCISEVTLLVSISFANQICNLEITLRLIYQGEDGEFFIFGEDGGKWKFIKESFFHKVELLH